MFVSVTAETIWQQENLLLLSSPCWTSSHLSCLRRIPGLGLTTIRSTANRKVGIPVFRIPFSGTLELQVRKWRRCFPISECKPRAGSHPTQGSHRRVKENGLFLDEGWQTGLLEAMESIVRCPSVLLFRRRVGI